MKKDKTKSKIGLIILAAGSSSRLGTPKQLISFRGETLLQRIVRESLKSLCHPIVVVLGKNADEFDKNLENAGVQTVKNRNWEQGMGTSISVGVRKITEIDSNTEGLVLCVCDQPFVTSIVINKLVNAFMTEKCKIIASAYAKTLGVPALFDKSLFNDLADLQGKIGAKKIIGKFSQETFSMDFPEGKIDIDTKEDLQKLQQL